ncbi:MAG: hypothetical protein AAF514_07975 [Verrucomicrobiota bacterium]
MILQARIAVAMERYDLRDHHDDATPSVSRNREIGDLVWFR